jgi:hypothetical protein
MISSCQQAPSVASSCLSLNPTVRLSGPALLFALLPLSSRLFAVGLPLHQPSVGSCLRTRGLCLPVVTMSAEALKAYQQFMGGSAGSNGAQQQQQGQQPGTNFQNPYAAGFGAHAQQVPQGLQNPYASQQQYLQSNPVYVLQSHPRPFVAAREGVWACTTAQWLTHPPGVPLISFRPLRRTHIP